MAFQVITDTAYADKLWELGLLYCSMPDESEWFLDDSYLDIYRGPLNDWRPSLDERNSYAILLED